MLNLVRYGVAFAVGVAAGVTFYADGVAFAVGVAAGVTFHAEISSALGAV